MAQLSPTKRAVIQAEIAESIELGTFNVDHLAAAHKVSRQTIYSVKKRLEERRQRKVMGEIVKTDPTTLDVVVDKIRQNTPAEFAEDVEDIIDSAKSLQKLETNFHSSFDRVLERADDLLNREDLSIIDWQIITTTLATAFKDIYNTSGTTVNINKVDQIGDNKQSLSMFQERMTS